MTILFAIALIIAGGFITCQASIIVNLRNRIHTGDIALDEALDECVTLREELSEWKFPHPPTRGMTGEIDAEKIISNSDDPIWSLVEECYEQKSAWELFTPGEAAKQPHQRYADFATFILNLPDDQQNVAGVSDAVAAMRPL